MKRGNMKLKHRQTFALILLAVVSATTIALYLGSLWGALAALVGGLTLAFVISAAWLWTPRSGVGRGDRATHDSFSGLP